jgi:hypothetical protein
MKHMRIRLLLLFMALISFGLVNGQSKSYVIAMKKAVTYLDTVTWGYANYVAGAEKFEFIATSAPGEWMPYYYHAFCATSLSRQVSDPASIDSLTGIADRDLRIADSLSPNNSEVYCLKSLNVISKINADYMRRGMSYSKIANDILDLAQKLDSGNPRIYYLRGSYLFFRPKQFGGGKDAARPWLEKANNIYDKRDIGQGDPTPHWGKRETSELLKRVVSQS